jgi:hypothetical protein
MKLKRKKQAKVEPVVVKPEILESEEVKNESLLPEPVEQRFIKPDKIEPDGRKIVVIDFDGVIHSYTSGWTEDARDIADSPHSVRLRKHGRNDTDYTSIDWLTDLVRHKELHICILSSRSKYMGAIDAMQAWLKQYGMSQETLDKISFPSEKPAAFMMIDDRAVRFTGQFIQAAEIKAFKTWQGK